MVSKLVVVFIVAFLAPFVFMTPTDELKPDTPLRRQKRIIGGSNTPITAYPFAGTLQLRGQLICGCSILNERSLLSAASCFPLDGNVNGYTVRIGSTEYQIGGILLDVTQFIPNPGFIGTVTIDNDIGVIRVSPAIPLGSATIQAATLPPADINIPDNSNVVAIGWGSATRGFLGIRPTEVLQSVELQVLNQDRCRTFFATDRVIVTANMLCARNAVGGTVRSTCNGDGGGALVFNDMVVAVTSFNVFGCSSGLPNVFTRVLPYLTFIANNA